MRLLRLGKAPSALVLEKIRSGVKIIDVHTPSEFAASSYPKAKDIPLGSLPLRIDELSKDKTAVLY
jgi:rhodanese-related sulfurtransferase